MHVVAGLRIGTVEGIGDGQGFQTGIRVPGEIADFGRSIQSVFGRRLRQRPSLAFALRISLRERVEEYKETRKR